ncbi:prepilin peptidase CpaA [Hasllibacter halocynthiae]|uniref:Prepilin peptidase CpaA n=1 Tax=Hasllibacter halocynthiae TaxID=595589 RepID=A0A2T0X9M3_9RHOB|nr:prepilin peptidase [Hasllibacter halocynthiae]PRY95629.1 prepilin peptidase CpaA [Hasllibacter halocynthiae]
MTPAENPYIWLLIAAVPFCMAAVWTDLTRMKIRNWTVLGLVAAFLVAGTLVLPPATVASQIAQAAVVLCVTFVLTMLRGMGAGDAKFLAATALYVPLAGVPLYAVVLCATVIAGFVLHRGARAIPALRGVGWESWSRQDFPMGLCLGSSLVIFLALAATGT